MKREWLMIPDRHNIQESLRLAEEYGAAFEYNDFFAPDVYSDEEEIKKRITLYKGCARDRSRDTLHGVFLDISVASKDPVIRDYSRKKVEQSMAIAQELGVKGVVFHSGLIGGLNQEEYLRHWYETQEALWDEMLTKYTQLTVYMENTFENTPDSLAELKRRLRKHERFQLCLDYGHACLGPTEPDKWFAQMNGNIGHIHINDNDLISDLHMVPGSGSIDFTYFKKLSERYDVNCPILLEVTGIEKQKKALEYMSAL